MTSATLVQPQGKMLGTKKWMLVTGLLLLVIIAAGLFIWYYNSNQTNLPPAASLAEFEAVSGISPKMIVVTAAGGIVDLRFKVVNSRKTAITMSDTAKFPRLVVEDSGLVLNAGAHHLNTYKDNAGYFMFYPNTGSAVKTGTALSVMVGDTRYGPIIAK